MATHFSDMRSDRRLLTLQQIRVVVAIAEHRSLGKAGEQLHMSQSAVSRTLRQVEERLGIRLFDRSQNGVTSTKFVAPILKFAPSINRAIRETARDLKLLNNPESQSLRLGAGIHANDLWINPAIASLVRSNPDVDISVEIYADYELADHLREGTVDYALSELGDYIGCEDLVIEQLAELDLHAICRNGHPLTTLARPDIKDLSCFPMVGNTLSRVIATQFDGLCGRLGRYDPVCGGMLPAIRVTTLSAIKSILLESDAIAVMPSDTVRADLDAGTLVALERSHMPWLVARTGFIFAKSRRVTPLMREFCSAVFAIESERRAR